jgi:PTH1 family peptidyl-tRNA hydrolase
MKVLVGLGNPGPRYSFTRHNAGFIFLDLLATQENARFSSNQFQGELARVTLFSNDFLLFKPMTFMNKSGQPLSLLMRFYKLAIEDMIVVYDDIDVPFGKVKTRMDGGAGGHNGIRSIIECLGGDKFARIKLGVGRPDAEFHGEVADWVLNDFKTEELEAVRSQMLGDGLDRVRGILGQKAGKT